MAGGGWLLSGFHGGRGPGGAPRRPPCLSGPMSCLTRDTMGPMGDVTIRELRNHGGEVIERVQKGERITVTRSGKPVAELRPLPRRGPDPETLLARWRNLPHIDPDRLRADIDEAIDQSL